MSVGNHTVRYTVTTNGCIGFTEQTVEIKALPSVNLSNNGPLTCATNPVILTATPGGATYVFIASTTQQGSSAGNTATVAQAGLFSVTLTNGFGCTATANTTVQLDIGMPGIASFSPTNNGFIVQLIGGVAYERVRAIDRVNGYEIQQTEMNKTGYFLITQAGPYSITAIGANGCRTVINGVAPTIR